MSKLFTQIGEAALKQQEQLHRSREDSNDIPVYRPTPIESTTPVTKSGLSETQESGNPDSQKIRTSTHSPASSSSPPARSPELKTSDQKIPFEPDELTFTTTFEKGTYELTDANLDFVNRTHYELRKWRINKRDIVQTALELLAKDFAQNQEQSYLLRKFRNRKPSLEIS